MSRPLIVVLVGPTYSVTSALGDENSPCHPSPKTPCKLELVRSEPFHHAEALIDCIAELIPNSSDTYSGRNRFPDGIRSPAPKDGVLSNLGRGTEKCCICVGSSPCSSGAHAPAPVVSSTSDAVTGRTRIYLEVSDLYTKNSEVNGGDFVVLITVWSLCTRKIFGHWLLTALGSRLK